MTLSVLRVYQTAERGGGVVRLHWVGLFVVLMTFAGIFAVAQGVSGRIVGTLTDSSGAVIPNAAVTITNQDTDIVTRVISNSNGEYRADNLPPGNYRVQIEAPGLQSIVSKGNVVTVDNATVVNLTMKVGSANETVTVSAANILQPSSERPSFFPTRPDRPRVGGCRFRQRTRSRGGGGLIRVDYGERQRNAVGRNHLHPGRRQQYGTVERLYQRDSASRFDPGNQSLH